MVTGCRCNSNCRKGSYTMLRWPNACSATYRRVQTSSQTKVTTQTGSGHSSPNKVAHLLFRLSQTDFRPSGTANSNTRNAIWSNAALTSSSNSVTLRHDTTVKPQPTLRSQNSRPSACGCGFMSPQPSRSGTLFTEGLIRGMSREIETETGISVEEGLYELVPYCFARELKRAGKPQFFFICWFKRHSAKQVFKLVNGRSPEEADEYADAQTRPIDRIWNVISRKSGRLRECEVIEKLNVKLLNDELLAEYSAQHDSDNSQHRKSVTYEHFTSLWFARKYVTPLYS
jgi:hypothetical protein